jgi:putative molybdopterin biosynthesis protein
MANTASLSVEDVAKILNVSERTVSRQVKAGKLKAFRVGRSLRFRPEAVEEYIRNQEISTDGKELNSDKSDEDGDIAA